MKELLCRLVHAYVTNDHSQTTVDELREMLLDLETEPVSDDDSDDEPEAPSGSLFGGDHS